MTKLEKAMKEYVAAVKESFHKYGDQVRFQGDQSLHEKCCALLNAGMEEPAAPTAHDVFQELKAYLSNRLDPRALWLEKWLHLLCPEEQPLVKTPKFCDRVRLGCDLRGIGVYGCAKDALHSGDCEFTRFVGYY